MKYRLYTMYEPTGHIQSLVDIEADNDAAAIELVQPRTGASPMEIWCDRRKVHRFESDATCLRAPAYRFGTMAGR